MNDWVVTGVIILLLLLFIYIAVRRRWFTRPRGSFTGITVYHDWVNQDAQRGVEIIIERNAGNKEEENDSGDPDFERAPAPDLDRDSKTNEEN